jgi:hypothetical protein
MRHPPAFQIEVTVGRAWRRALAALVWLACASLLWWLHGHLAVPSWPWAVAVAGAALLPVWAVRWHLLKQAPQSLRWDGQLWLLDTAGQRGNEARQGRLHVLLDFDAWLLLRFAELPPRRFKRRHLVLSRAELPQQWHQLRSTIYSAAGSSAAEPATKALPDDH